MAAVDGEKFILCAGGHARRLDFPGAELALTHSDVWRLQGAAALGGDGRRGGDRLPARLDLARFRRPGHRAGVAPRILPGEDRPSRRRCRAAFAGGIEVRTGISGIERIERKPTALPLVYKQGGEVPTLEAAASCCPSAGWATRTG